MSIILDGALRKYLRENNIPASKQVKRVWKWRGDYGLGIAVFEGNKGDIKADRYIFDCSREECPFSTGLVRGSFWKYKSSDGSQRMYKPGETTDGDPDIKQGFVECQVMEDNTVLICIGPLSPKTGQFEWGTMYKKTHYSKEHEVLLELKKKHVGALVYGSVKTADGKVITAPGVVSAKNKDVTIVLAPHTTLMEGWR